MLRLRPRHALCVLTVTAYSLATNGLASSSESAEKAAPLGQLDVVPSTLFKTDMVELDVNGHKCFVLIPAKPAVGGSKPWVWYAPTLLADREQNWMSPGERHAWIFKRLSAGGVYVAGVDVGESYGSPAGRAVYTQFYDHLVRRLGFSPKPGLLPISRGGMMAYNWAAEHPHCVSCIGGIYPMCNLRGYARLERVSRPYGMTGAELLRQSEQHNPVDRLRPLASAGVPILHLHGDQDTSVSLESHSAELARRYKALEGTVELIVVRGKGHEVVPEYWQEPRLVEFLLQHVIVAAKASLAKP